MKTLAERMIYARELRGWSQAELAAHVPCSQSTIGNIESGYRKSMRNIVAAARALNVTPDWLEDGRGPGPGGTLIAAEPGHDLPTIRPEIDAHTAEVIRIMATLDSGQKPAALARLREVVSYLDPPRNGQALQVAG